MYIKVWTDNEIEILKNNHSKISTFELAKLIGRPITSVRNKITEYKIGKKKQIGFTDEEFLNAIKNSTSHAEAYKRLGYKASGSVNLGTDRRKYSKYFWRLRPDISHFKLFSRGFTNDEYSIYQCQYNWEQKRSCSRGYEFKLTLEDFEKLITGRCSYCGCQGGSKLKGHPKTKINGIDRLDNNQGYIVGNCISCCHDCNMMKHNKIFDSWLLKVKQIYEYLGLSDSDLKL